jgi:hypothetical protein
LVKAISQFVVHVFDLIEAEGRMLLEVVRGEARRAHLSVVHLLLGVGFLAVSVPLIVAGVLLVGAGVFWGLEAVLGRPAGAAVTGVLVIGIGALCMWGFWKLAKGTAEIIAERESVGSANAGSPATGSASTRSESGTTGGGGQ